MNFLSNFHFIRPLALLLLPAVVAIWWFVNSRKDPLRNWRRAIEPDLLKAMLVNQDGMQKRHGMAILVAWLLAAISIAGPTWKPEASPFADDPVPVMVVLKAGKSMQQTDLIPNRMELARLKVIDFCELRKGQPVGLIAYSGTAHLVLPPTRDTSVVGSMATEIGPDIMPKSGDELVSALRLASSTLGQDGGAIVILADTVAPEQLQQLGSINLPNRLHLLGVARTGTPEETDLKKAATALRAQLTLMTPGDEDISLLTKRVATTPIGVATQGKGTRWSEAGWWLVPVIGLFALASFRREENEGESAA